MIADAWDDLDDEPDKPDDRWAFHLARGLQPMTVDALASFLCDYYEETGVDKGVLHLTRRTLDALGDDSVRSGRPYCYDPFRRLFVLDCGKYVAQVTDPGADRGVQDGMVCLELSSRGGVDHQGKQLKAPPQRCLIGALPERTDE